MEIPNDPHILVSFINMKLRDFYPSLDILLDINRDELDRKLNDAGYEYNAELNKYF